MKRLQTLKQTAATVERLQLAGKYPKGPLLALSNLVLVLADVVLAEAERTPAERFTEYLLDRESK